MRGEGGVEGWADCDDGGEFARRWREEAPHRARERGVEVRPLAADSDGDAMRLDVGICGGSGSPRSCERAGCARDAKSRGGVIAVVKLPIILAVIFPERGSGMYM